MILVILWNVLERIRLRTFSFFTRRLLWFSSFLHVPDYSVNSSSIDMTFIATPIFSILSCSFTRFSSSLSNVCSQATSLTTSSLSVFTRFGHRPELLHSSRNLTHAFSQETIGQALSCALVTMPPSFNPDIIQRMSSSTNRLQNNVTLCHHLKPTRHLVLSTSLHSSRSVVLLRRLERLLLHQLVVLVTADLLCPSSSTTIGNRPFPTQVQVCPVTYCFWKVTNLIFPLAVKARIIVLKNSWNPGFIKVLVAQPSVDCRQGARTALLLGCMKKPLLSAACPSPLPDALAIWIPTILLYLCLQPVMIRRCVGWLWGYYWLAMLSWVWLIKKKFMNFFERSTVICRYASNWASQILTFGQPLPPNRHDLTSLLTLLGGALPRSPILPHPAPSAFFFFVCFVFDLR